ncbi:DNA cytosine methyltransferase [Aeromonas veronii]
MIYGSVCSGIEAASLAWEPLGWNPAWFAEIEPFPSAVLAHHWPHATNLGDMTKIATAVLKGDVVAPDILVGGTPCQAFSVAGAREGLADDRGFLTIKYVELANAIDQKRAAAGAVPCITVWENVPGVLSSKDNAFGAFLGFLCRGRLRARPTREEMGKRWLCAWPPKSNRVADPRCPIFRSGPTPPPCVRCRKCSRRVRSRKSSF